MSPAIRLRASRSNVYRTDSLNPVTAVKAAAPSATDSTTKMNFPSAARVSRQAMRRGNRILLDGIRIITIETRALARVHIFDNFSVSQDNPSFRVRGQL